MPTVLTGVVNYKLDAAFITAPVHTPKFDRIPIKLEQLVIITPESIKALADVINKQPLKIVVFDQGIIIREHFESWITSNGIINY